MKILVALAVLFVSASFPPRSAQSDAPTVPWRVQECMGSPELKSYRIDFRTNPFYLRGDFDADGLPYLAVEIVGPKSESTRLLICQGNGKHFVLGAGSQPPFTSHRDDNFLSSDWEVITLQEFRGLLYDAKLGIRARGEVIALSWEDGSGYVYWDGASYRWIEEPAGSKKNS